MHRGILVKFFAIALCAAVLATALCSAGGILMLVSADLYTQDVASLQQQQENLILSLFAEDLARRYAAETYSDLSSEALESYLYTHYHYEDRIDSELLFYTLKDGNGNILSSKAGNYLSSQVQTYEFWVAPSYPVVLDSWRENANTGEIDPEDMPDATVPTQASHVEYFSFYDTGGFYHNYRLDIRQGPTYLVTLYLLPGAFTPEYQWTWKLASLGYAHRFNLIWVLGASLLVFALLIVFLCCVAGRKPKSQEVRPAGLNRLPLDLYAGIVGIAIFVLAAGGYELIFWNLEYFDPQWLLVLLVAAMAYVGCLLLVGFLFAFAAQSKVENGFWYTHTVIGWSIRLLIRSFRKFFGWLKKPFGWLGKKLPVAAKKTWSFTAALCIAVYTGLKKIFLSVFSLLSRGLSALWRFLHRIVSLLPLTWQWLLTAFLLLFIMAITVVPRRSPGLVILGIGICMAIVMYGTYCFGLLLERTKRMGQGDLDTKVEDKLLLGSFRDYATHLNALADVAVDAAKKQMKSERMKAELVTNVSHDIKTPLTSIINYVDLLQKAETPEQTAEYLEVLDRQAQRLKKLIDDLMEMSKASTGNMSVDLSSVDAAETVNQALGEFADKLAQAQLTPVFNPPELPIYMEADGRLAWRVLSNLLSNAVKYALPGTRLYIDLAELDDQVLISLKNISREPLNISSEELMERFVRGDASRNTEGSGLGLNIARSLMELQKGQMQLLVDGDLFKVTLFFPAHR